MISFYEMLLMIIAAARAASGKYRGYSFLNLLFMIRSKVSIMNFQSDILRMNEIAASALICVLNPYNVLLTYIRAIAGRGSAHAC